VRLRGLRIVNRIACAFLVSFLLGSAALKVLFLMGPAGNTMIAHRLLAGMAGLEVLLAGGLATRLRSLACMATLSFTLVAGAVMTTLRVKGVLGRLPCGCLGGIRMGFTEHMMLLTGIAALSLVALITAWEDRHIEVPVLR